MFLIYPLKQPWYYWTLNRQYEYWHTCFHAMSLADDLSDDKLETTIRKNPERVFHVEYTSDLARGLKKVAVVKKWSPQKHLGAGSFGTVRLEKLEDDSGKSDPGSDIYRAVKILDKMQLARSKIDYKKELIALSKFSKPKVLTHIISDEVPLTFLFIVQTTSSFCRVSRLV